MVLYFSLTRVKSVAGIYNRIIKPEQPPGHELRQHHYLAQIVPPPSLSASKANERKIYPSTLYHVGHESI